MFWTRQVPNSEASVILVRVPSGFCHDASSPSQARSDSACLGWLGAVAAFLVLSIAALMSEDPQTVRSAYLGMNLIAGDGSSCR